MLPPHQWASTLHSSSSTAVSVRIRSLRSTLNRQPCRCTWRTLRSLYLRHRVRTPPGHSQCRTSICWYCYVTGTGAASSWTRLSAPSLNLLSAPFRVYDSRAGQPNPSGSPKGGLVLGNAPRAINCAPAVPAPASAILFNLTITETVGAGSLLVWAAGQTEPLASSINWTARDQVVANSVTSGCDDSQAVQVVVSSGVAGSSTQFVLDVIGYYRVGTVRALARRRSPAGLPSPRRTAARLTR